jgi:hypothetical protein
MRRFSLLAATLAACISAGCPGCSRPPDPLVGRWRLIADSAFARMTVGRSRVGTGARSDRVLEFRRDGMVGAGVNDPKAAGKQTPSANPAGKWSKRDEIYEVRPASPDIAGKPVSGVPPESKYYKMVGDNLVECTTSGTMVTDGERYVKE